jgi:hypothetical protein
MTTLSNPEPIKQSQTLTNLGTQYVFPGATIASPQIQRKEVPDNKYIGFRDGTGAETTTHGVSRYGVVNHVGSDVVFTGYKVH